MLSNLVLKNTLLFIVLFTISCGNSVRPVVEKLESNAKTAANSNSKESDEIITGAENTAAYLPLLNGIRIGIVTNQTGIYSYKALETTYVQQPGKQPNTTVKNKEISIVDYLIGQKLNVVKIFAPEHGFRGTADAGELVKDGKDSKTGLPIISLYGDNKKPKVEQLAGIDVLVFDLQDVGARFYTYISSLHYVMEACAENNIPLIILDRPNPNGDIVDGPVLEKEYTSFVGMHPIPVLHGMTIGEYGKMINGQKWLKNGVQCKLTVIPCLNYKKSMSYSLPVKPSPNLPNDQSVNLYASLCFFEGTNVSVGRGTNKQFQIYGSPFLKNGQFIFTPKPNEGAKEPPYKGQICYGEDLSSHSKLSKLELKWLIKAYHETADQDKFFNPFFSKLAGTNSLKTQIAAGWSASDIRESWQDGITKFKIIRKLYEIY